MIKAGYNPVVNKEPHSTIAGRLNVHSRYFSSNSKQCSLSNSMNSSLNDFIQPLSSYFYFNHRVFSIAIHFQALCTCEPIIQKNKKIHFSAIPTLNSDYSYKYTKKDSCHFRFKVYFTIPDI
jgi:hypothetical protein